MKKKSQAIPAEGRRSMYGGIGARLSHIGQGGAGRGALLEQPPTSALTSEEIDSRCQLIFSEIDRCEGFGGRYIESDVLHDVPQTFVPGELRVELELQLDRLLNEQILREERLLAATSSDSSSTHRILKPGFDSTIEAETGIESSKSSDGDECLACNGRCKWAPFCDANDLASRRKQLYSELKSVEISYAKIVPSVVARSAMNGGETTFLRRELVRELSDEIRQIDSKLKLTRIDEELHRTHASEEESVSIRSIHGYDTTVKRRDAIWALEHEHNRHVAQMVADETIDGILQWLLEGWWFGERDTKDKRKPELLEVPSFDQRGTLLDKASSVQIDSNSEAIRDAHASSAAQEDLDVVQTSMKYGLFCLTFMYFRALHVLRKEKAAWDGSNDLVSLRHGPPLSEERKRMIQEEENAELRKNRLDYAMQKARAGEERKQQRLEKERFEKAKIREWDNRKKHAEQRLATTVQRVFRGHLGRNLARMRALQKGRAEYANALANACATDIVRVWRGYCGRLDAGYLRAEMAKFLFAIREEEAKDEEEEYLATTNRLQRYTAQRKKERKSTS